MYRSVLWLGTALWLIVMGGLGYVFARHDALPRYRSVPPLAFAGSDLVYVLRRIAAEADLILALDEMRTSGQMEDLRNRFVDVDLGGTTAGGALEALRQEVGGFSYDFRHGLLYVHSATELPKDTGIDRKELPGGRFEGDLRGLGAWIMKMRPATYLSVHLEVGHPAGPKVRLQVPPESSVLDILLLYAKKAGVGWRMRRAGETRPTAKGQLLVVASEVTPSKALPEAHHTWAFRQVDSLVQVLGRIESRTSTPICIADVAPFYANRGTLELALSSDPAYPIEKTLQVLAAAHNSNAAPPFPRFETSPKRTWPLRAFIHLSLSGVESYGRVQKADSRSAGFPEAGNPFLRHHDAPERSGGILPTDRSPHAPDASDSC